MSKVDKPGPGFHRPLAGVADRVAIASRGQRATSGAPKGGAAGATDPKRGADPMPEQPAGVDEESLFMAEMRQVSRAERAPDEYLIPRRPPVGTLPGRRRGDVDVAMTQPEELVEHGYGFDLSFTDEHVEGLAHGVDRRLLRRLKRGEFASKAHLDLHGKTRKEARELVERFVADSRKSAFRCVLIIHGRGLHSKDRVPVLKDALGLWLLRGRIARSVLAFCSAKPPDGGLGAVYVLLRR